VLTWRLGPSPRQRSAREVVLFAFDKSPEAVLRHLEAARRQFAQPLLPPSSAPAGAPKGQVWIANAATDFAWKALASSAGTTAAARPCGVPAAGSSASSRGYLHYEDRAGKHRAGHAAPPGQPPENLRIVEPVRPAECAEAAGAVETADGKYRIGVHARWARGLWLQSSSS